MAGEVSTRPPPHARASSIRLFAAPPDFDNNAAHMTQLRDMFNERLRGAVRNAQQYSQFCHGVKFIEDKKSIMGYRHLGFDSVQSQLYDEGIHVLYAIHESG